MIVPGLDLLMRWLFTVMNPCAKTDFGNARPALISMAGHITV